jgi:hypothetical protein
MSICASGASQAKAGLADTVVISATVIAASLTPELLWLDPYIAGTATLLNIHLPTFCTIDPPADPGLSGTDMVAIALLGNANPDPGPMQRMGQLILRGLWNVFCECTSGGPPTVSVPTAAPAGSPAINPPSVTTQPTVGNCFAISLTGIQNVDGVEHYYTTGTDTTTDNYLPLPQGAAFATISAQASTPGATPYDRQFNFQFKNLAGAIIGGSPSVDVGPVGNPATAPQTQSATAAVPAGALTFHVESIVQGAGTKTGTFAVQASISCGGAAGQPIQACCPPDAVATGLLNSILQMVTLVQRQIAPFAYVTGASHAGLSGNGTIAVSGLLGIKVDVTTAPGRLGETLGDPTTIWDAGWVNIGTPDGFGPRQFISSNPMVILPVSGAATSIGYSIPPDVTITITELAREP